MDQSRRAVESYWRSRLIDGATSDEDKVTPVYKLEEICELLRSSHVSIVKEVSEFILKRLQHKSPVVKQKALRVIKYAVGKSGAEFRREMQRNSVAVRQLIHYKGQPDPLKGDALNKAVRETAQETLSALFANEDSKPSPAENLSRRIEGFGNTNFNTTSDDKKSFLTEVVNIGSSTIKQGLSSFTQSPSLKKNETGSYRSPNLQRSLTRENDAMDRYEGLNSSNGSQNSSRFSGAVDSSNWNQDRRSPQLEAAGGDPSSNYGDKTREEKLLETIVTSGGVRLQPTRDALQVFLSEALKLDALALSYALESKLQSPMWQVRMKAVCVLEALLRRKDEEHFTPVALYFNENRDVVVKCSESPQASLREKANKVLGLLAGEQTVNGASHEEKGFKAEATAFQMPDLIDTGDPDELVTNDFLNSQDYQSTEKPSTSAAPLIGDLFGEGQGTDLGGSGQKGDDDPFADVSFHSGNNKEQEGADIFSGMNLDKSGTTESFVAVNQGGPELFDIFGSTSEVPLGLDNSKRDMNDMMAGLSVDGNSSSEKQSGKLWGTEPKNVSSNSKVSPTSQAPSDVFNSMITPQAIGMNSNPMFSVGDTPYSLAPGFMLNPSFATQPVNYNAMASLLAQQQLLATMSNFQQLGNLQSNPGAVAGPNGSYSSPLPDIFNPSLPNQTPPSMISTSKKEETKAFDFISDHLAAARDPKRVV
ncbi:OLC1v1008553C1 [Oldenlandia corymbosa var. corymbosa]|uniref:OLC1v1008553C1 n=1 Tax=Oldenlandia corymbosa var. corymbosa TaxID=529605 RepID=A0AAV1DPP5_OLDCO|nr:OLC1v1008553C1 [Oldenlandia corymbosa var. corymbosa]